MDFVQTGYDPGVPACDVAGEHLCKDVYQRGAPEVPRISWWVVMVEIHDRGFAIHTWVLGRCGISGVGEGLHVDLNR